MYIDSTGVCLAVIYVDDGIIAGPRKLVEHVYTQLISRVEITDLSEPEDFLGMPHTWCQNENDCNDSFKCCCIVYLPTSEVFFKINLFSFWIL